MRKSTDSKDISSYKDINSLNVLQELQNAANSQEPSLNTQRNDYNLIDNIVLFCIGATFVGIIAVASFLFTIFVMRKHLGSVLGGKKYVTNNNASQRVAVFKKKIYQTPLPGKY